MTGHQPNGFTLIEFVLGTMTLAIAMAAIFGAYVGQVTLNEHARNLTLAVHDANRVIEGLRQLNWGCTAQPSAVSTVGSPASWDAWLTGSTGGGKSIGLSSTDELIAVTCLRRGAPATPADADYCGTTDQVGSGEWKTRAANTDYDPIQVTVAVCWRHRNRTIGECTWGGAALTAQDGANGPNSSVGIIESPAMLTTLVTCRS